MAEGQFIVAIDAAHFGDDESVIHMRKGRLNLPQVFVRGLDGPQLAWRVEEECRTLKKAGEHIHAIVIELDGPGVSCYDQLRRGEFREYTQGVHTGARVQNNRDYNIRAKMWREAREYLEEVPNSLPPDPELKAQLSSLKYLYKDGLLLIQSKKDYKGEFGKSPDRADAFVLTFAAKKRPANGHRPSQANTDYSVFG